MSSRERRLEKNQRKGKKGREETATCWWCPTVKGAPVVLLLAAARGKHRRRAMGVGVEWIEEILWLAVQANQGGAVGNAGWWLEENKEEGSRGGSRPGGGGDGDNLPRN